MGSLERFLSLLIEHTAGDFPAWLAPVQAVVVPVGDKFADYGKNVYDELAAAGIRVELADTNDSLGKRIRSAELMKIPYVLVVGEKEAAAKSVAVRTRKGDEGAIPLGDFIKKIEKEIKEKK